MMDASCILKMQDISSITYDQMKKISDAYQTDSDESIMKAV